MYCCGIDIAKNKHEASVIDENGKAMLESISFSNSREGCEKLLELFERLSVTKENLLIGMEATGHYWLSVYGYLLENGFTVKVINPIQSEAFRRMYIRQTKNDSRDSFIIAQIMRFGQFSSTHLSEENIVAMRQLSRYRLSLVDTCGDCKRRIIALLDQVFPEYADLFSDTFGVTSQEVLSKAGSGKKRRNSCKWRLPAPLASVLRKTRSRFRSVSLWSSCAFWKARLKNLSAILRICFDRPAVISRPFRASEKRSAQSFSAKLETLPDSAHRISLSPLRGWTSG